MATSIDAAALDHRDTLAVFASQTFTPLPGDVIVTHLTPKKPRRRTRYFVVDQQRILISRHTQANGAYLAMVKFVHHAARPAAVFRGGSVGKGGSQKVHTGGQSRGTLYPHFVSA